MFRMLDRCEKGTANSIYKKTKDMTGPVHFLPWQFNIGMMLIYHELQWPNDFE